MLIRRLWNSGMRGEAHSSKFQSGMSVCEYVCVYVEAFGNQMLQLKYEQLDKNSRI